MKPPPFVYHAPTSLGEAHATLATLGDEARILAGGQSLVPLMNFRLATPAHLVDINRINELEYLRGENGWLAIGARVRQSTLESSADAAEQCPLLIEAVRLVGHPTIRHRGTVCGSVAHADPSAELPAALMALDAEVVLSSQQGERAQPIAAFLQGALTTTLQPGELLKEVRVKRREGPYAFVEYSHRHGDYAIAGAAVQLHLRAGSQVIDDAAIVLCGVSDRPARARKAEQVLLGAQGLPDERAAAAEAAIEGLTPNSDLQGSAEYRRRIARACVRRALDQALDRAHGGIA
jgi:aerobic carbon-monoxide dehydrogenase medium subunit